MGLSATTLLGENTVPILDGLCRRLAVTDGLEIVRDDDGPAPDRAGDADLVWACGYLMCELIDAGRVDAEIVAAPVFAGQQRAVYHSVVVAVDPSIRSLSDAGGRSLAINEPISWSGHLALVEHLTTLGSDLSTFGRIVETGSHRASVAAVAAGEADLAAIDHTVWADLARRSQIGPEMRVIDRTRDWPAPPFAVHRRVSAGARRALLAALVAVSPGEVVGLAGVSPASRLDYEVMSPRHPPPNA